MTSLQPTTAAEVQECVREHAARAPKTFLRPVAGRSKQALSWTGDAVALDVSALRGVTDYQPDECTFTAHASTPVAEVEPMLAAKGQYLPFDPPFASRGATLGGTVAAALSGPARFRYGGIRDFLLGVRFVDGEGRLIRGGGRVVKNAAGFYLQHLMLGSLGRLGVLTELTFKVFPHPQARTTLMVAGGTLERTVDVLAKLRRSAFELESVELAPPATLAVRVGGSSHALEARVATLTRWFADLGVEAARIEDAAEEARIWHEARELTWAPPGPLVKISTTLGRIAALDAWLSAEGVARRYGAGGEMGWVAWPGDLARFDAMLGGLDVPGLLVQGTGRPDPFLGPRPDPEFLGRVRRTLDPRGTFSPALL